MEIASETMKGALMQTDKKTLLVVAIVIVMMPVFLAAQKAAPVSNEVQISRLLADAKMSAYELSEVADEMYFMSRMKLPHVLLPERYGREWQAHSETIKLIR